LTYLENELTQALRIKPAGIVSETSQQRFNTETVKVQRRVTTSALLTHPLPEGDEQRRILIRFNGNGQ
jgi:hypothetical protein